MLDPDYHWTQTSKDKVWDPPRPTSRSLPAIQVAAVLSLHSATPKNLNLTGHGSSVWVLCLCSLNAPSEHFLHARPWAES